MSRGRNWWRKGVTRCRHGPIAPDVTDLLREAMASRRGAGSVEGAEWRLGGEDFSWCLEHAPRRHDASPRPHPGERTVRDLRQGDFDADEYVITAGVELFTAAGLLDEAQG